LPRCASTNNWRPQALMSIWFFQVIHC
jgi:hypothetical protein